MTSSVRINRSQLAKICSDDTQAIRAFEELFRRSDDAALSSGQSSIIDGQLSNPADISDAISSMDTGMGGAPVSAEYSNPNDISDAVSSLDSNIT